MTNTSMIDTELNILFLALKITYVLHLENDYDAFRNFARALRKFYLEKGDIL